MKSPKKNGIGEVVTDYGRRVMRIFKKGLLQRSLFDFYGDIKADSVKIKESSSVPGTPLDGDGGVVYIKSADGKLYFKSNEVSEVELSSSGATLTTEEVQDIVGAMFSSNTETNITATYEDSDGTIDLVATDTNTQLTTEEVQDIVGAMFTSNTETRISATYEDSDGTIDLVVDDMTADTNTQLTNEEVQDIVGAMFTGNTETRISATYQDSDGTIDLVVNDIPVDLTVSGDGTIHSDNVPTLNQSTTGNAATATASAGNFTVNGDLTVTGNDIKDDDGTTCITFDSSGNTSIGGTLSCSDLDITGSANALTINSTTGNVAINASSTDADCMVRVSDNSTAGTNAIGMVGTGDDLVMRNDEGNFKVKMANNATTTLNLDQNGNLDITGNILPGITEVKIFPRDFIPDDVGRPAMIDDTSSDRFLESFSTAKLYANVEIPLGFKATHVHIYGSGTSAMTVYEADVNSKTVTSKGTGNIGTNLNITDVTADATNYILIELAQTSSEEVYGGIMTIAKV